MRLKSGLYTALLRRELTLRNRQYARGRSHVETYGGDPVIVYAPETVPDQGDHDDATSTAAERHGNFLDEAYQAIFERAEWRKRFNKIHAQGRSIPKLPTEPIRKWRELDSSMSSDALLMNVFCTSGVVASAAVRRALGVDADEAPVFGWKARVPLANGLLDRTEVDMQWGGLLVEAKLTESDFQMQKASLVERYRDFDQVFERELLPRVKIVTTRKKDATEFSEEFTQEWEDTAGLPQADVNALAIEHQAGIVARAIETAQTETRYESYQLIRNVLAAYAAGSSFCVLHDERRPDLREAWFEVMAAVKSAKMRVRLKVLTWQELAAMLPDKLQEFLDVKYGIVRSGRCPSPIPGTESLYRPG